MMYEGEKNRFLKRHGYPLNLDNPKSFNEKIVYKKIFDRNPLIPRTADKYRARQYIRDRVGWEADNHLIPLLWVGKNPEDIPFDRLPDEYIIKPNNGSGRYILAERDNGSVKYDINYIHKEGINLSNKEIIDECKDWFKTIHGAGWYEWAYQEIKPLIVIEKLLKDNKNNIPNDYKFFMFNFSTPGLNNSVSTNGGTTLIFLLTPLELNVCLLNLLAVHTSSTIVSILAKFKCSL